jgi:hypothetical protein
MMDDLEVRSVLRKVGYVLLVVGLLDIGQMIYCIVRGLSYHSSLKIFAVIAGIFLIRGSVRTAGIVLWFATFMLAGFTCVIVAWPLFVPPGLALAELRLHTLWVSGSLTFTVAVLGFLYWVVWQLRSIAISPAGLWFVRVRSLRSAVAAGVGLVGIIVILAVPLMRGESAQRAIKIAASQLGPGYDYYVTSISWTSSTRGTEVFAVVTAWNRREIRNLPVRWHKD